MLLRHKFGVLALIYVLSLCANLVVSGWCIIVYFRSSFVRFEAEFAREQQIERMLGLVRLRAAELDQFPAASRPAGGPTEAQRALSAMLARLDAEMAAGPLGGTWLEIREAERRHQEALLRMLDPARSPQEAREALGEIRAACADMERGLLKARTGLERRRRESEARTAEVQEQVMRILLANAAVGVAICGAGVLFVRRWVIWPVSSIREATREISAGNFAYRLRPQSRDELGQLADEVNRMSATIVSMQERIVDRERLVAAGEMATRVAHNIRNPLAGIRGLAEATAQRNACDPETVECQRRIIETIDRFEKWLRDLQQSVAPLSLNPQPVSVAEFIDNVLKVLRPMLDRRNVRVEVEVHRGVGRVRMDAVHMEQALVALVTNAVQASEPGQTVLVAAEPAPDIASTWRLVVADRGPGIPPEIREKIFLPHFTTKPDGQGIGLAIASKVVRMHGGELRVESEPGRGSRFIATLPGLLTEGPNGQRADRR